MISTEECNLYKILKELNIEFIRYEHKAVYTVEEAQAIDLVIPGKHCKNLFLRNRKGNKYYLVITLEDKEINLKDLSKNIGSTNLSFASKERLYNNLKLTPGSVTPFGLINNKDRNTTVILDNNLKGEEKINFHPNINTATISVSFHDLLKFLNQYVCDIKYI